MFLATYHAGQPHQRPNSLFPTTVIFVGGTLKVSLPHIPPASREGPGPCHPQLSPSLYGAYHQNTRLSKPGRHQHGRQPNGCVSTCRYPRVSEAASWAAEYRSVYRSVYFLVAVSTRGSRANVGTNGKATFIQECWMTLVRFLLWTPCCNSLLGYPSKASTF